MSSDGSLDHPARNSFGDWVRLVQLVWVEDLQLIFFAVAPLKAFVYLLWFPVSHHLMVTKSLAWFMWGYL